MKLLEQILVAVDCRKLVRCGDPSEQILAVAADQDTDLIVMGSMLTIPKTKVGALSVRSLECIRRKTTRWKYLWESMHTRFPPTTCCGC